jgi:hypothetical protein
MSRCLDYLTISCLGLAIAGCSPSESQRAQNQVDESAKSQKLTVDRDSEATKKAIDETAASTKNAIKQNVEARRKEADGEGIYERQRAADLEDAAKRAKANAAKADERAKAAN